MAIIPLFRVILFILITLFSLAVVGLCAHIEVLLAGYTDLYTSFIPFGLGAGGLTIITLPLFLILGNLGSRVCTSTILFEIIWFFVLWILWIGAAGDTVVGRSYSFPYGCIYDAYPTVNQICFEVTAIEALCFVNFFCAFVYYDVIFLYAIINACRGRGVWTSSVKEATTGIYRAPMVQTQLAHPTQYQTYGAYPPNVVPPQQYGAYPQQPQGPVPQQYAVYPGQIPPQGQVAGAPGQNPQYAGYVAPGSPQSPQQASFTGYSPSPTSNNAALPPQPNYTAYPPAGAAQGQPGGYQGQPVNPQQQSQGQYGTHQPIPV